VRPLLAIAFLALVPFVTTAQDQPAGTWLDSAPVQWNHPGASIPLPAFVGPGRPQDTERNITPEYCKAQQRPVRLQEERVVAGAGWLVFASFKSKDGVTIVGGALSEDGMCRPDPYQYFVFVRGKFAGTLSPGLMRVRSDGSVNKVSFAGLGKIVATFGRYTATEPLCCPSRVSEATRKSGRNLEKPSCSWLMSGLVQLEAICNHRCWYAPKKLIPAWKAATRA
jgi:LppP/LprE lipoprotein